MVPVDLHDFLDSSLAASATFIGLLFVALSLALQKTKSNNRLEDSDRLLAQSSFAALINIFFVSLVGLEPHVNIGFVCLALAIYGLISCWKLFLSNKSLQLIFLALVYMLEAIFAVYTLSHNYQLINTGDFVNLVILLFIGSLVRAWKLVGIKQK